MGFEILTRQQQRGEGLGPALSLTNQGIYINIAASRKLLTNPEDKFDFGFFDRFRIWIDRKDLLVVIAGALSREERLWTLHGTSSSIPVLFRVCKELGLRPGQVLLTSGRAVPLPPDILEFCKDGREIMVGDLHTLRKG